MSVITPIKCGPSASVPGSIAIVLRDFRLGGSERVAIGLANYWASRQIAVTLLVGREDGPLRALLDPSVEIVDLGLSPALGDTRLAWSLAFHARAVLRRRKIESCYVPGNSHWPVIPMLKSLPAGQAPHIVAQVSSPVCRSNRSRLVQIGYDWRMRRLLGKADVITTLSEPLARETREIVGCAHVDVVPLPALWDEGRPCPVPEGSATILAAGRLVPIKGFDLLINAFHVVAARHAEARLVICGEGPERGALESLIDALGLAGRVTLTGYVPSIRPYLEQARLFVLSSHCESFGAVLLEALAAGRQIVSTRCSPAVDTLTSDTIAGHSVPTRDVAALAGAISALLSHSAPDCEVLASLVAPFHVSRGGEDFLALMRSRSGEPRLMERLASECLDLPAQSPIASMAHAGLTGHAL
ncbi:glycosyltransferase [Asaia siamensis]